MNRIQRNFLAAIICAQSALFTATSGEPNTATPAEKDPPRHTGFLDDIKKMHGSIDLVFVGDSITDGWRGG